jgi:hypothetical protein
MRMFIARVAGFCFGLSLLVLATTTAQEPTKSVTAYPPQGESLRALARWRVMGKDAKLVCVVSEAAASKTDELPTRSLRIYREEASGLVELYKFETPDSVINIYPLGDFNARLVVTWVGGSSYHLRILAFLEGQVKQVFDEGSKLSPEFLYDDKGRESVLLTEPSFENGRWTATNGTTTVFMWHGQSYEKIGTVPWVKRLQCLSKESCASLK